LGEEDVDETNTNPLIVGKTFGDMVPFGDPMWYQDWYSPYYNDTHRTLRKFVRDFVEKEVMPYCHEWDEAKAIPKELFIKTAKAGLQGAVVGHVDPNLLPYGLPAGIGQKDWDNFHSLIVTDELARCGSGGVSIIIVLRNEKI
jgi:alkylation response protein AidB-like acyl-CoA dehydrogenase